MRRYIFVVLFVIIATFECGAQRVSVSSDALRWATLSPNIGVDVSVTPYITAGVDLSMKMWNTFADDFSPKHISINPKARYWLKQPHYAHFVGAGLRFIAYEKTYDNVYSEGSLAALNFTYGYSFILTSRWNVTPALTYNIGFNGDTSKELSTSASKYLFYPIELGVSFTYILN